MEVEQYSEMAKSKVWPFWHIAKKEVEKGRQLLKFRKLKKSVARISEVIGISTEVLQDDRESGERKTKL